MKDKIRILVIPGSLRKDSSNHKIINQLASIAPGRIEFNIYNDLGNLPHFDGEEGYEFVDKWRKQIQDADGVLICTPEYAFGVPGSLKNALDWTVSSADFYEKPVALITASSSGDKGHAALLNILTAITAKMNDDTKLLIPFIRSKFNEKGELNIETLIAVEKVLKNLIKLIETSKENEA
jgi:NAD(P)H-dependent FMN reductase